MKLCTMSPNITLRNTLESRPRIVSALFTACLLLAQMGTAAASGNCGVITGP